MASDVGKKEAESSKEFGNKDYYNGFSQDTEAQGGQTAQRYRKGSRIDRPVTNSIAGNIDGRKPSVDMTVEEGEISVGNQIEAEAGNAIQYRTCSWYKV